MLTSLQHSPLLRIAHISDKNHYALLIHYIAYPFQVRFADTDAASETSRDVPSLDSGCCHIDETTMTSPVRASYENAYCLETPRRPVEKQLASPPGAVLHSTPVNCYCPYEGYSKCQCGLSPEVRHVFADSFNESVATSVSVHDNTIEPSVQWHRAFSNPDTMLAEFNLSYGRKEDMTSPFSQSQTSSKAEPPISDRSGEEQQDSSNSSSVII